MNNNIDQRLSSYLDFIPNEILTQIFIYLDVDNLESIKGTYQSIDNLLMSKLFWINKLNSEGLSRYTRYLGKFETESSLIPGSYINDYYKIHEATDEADFIYKNLEKYQTELLLPVNRDVDVQKFIHSDNLIFIKNSILKHIQFRYLVFDKPKNAHKIDEWNIKYKLIDTYITTSITDEDFRFLLSKLILTGINVIKFTQLEEIFEEEAAHIENY